MKSIFKWEKSGNEEDVIFFRTVHLFDYQVTQKTIFVWEPLFQKDS